MIKEKFIHDISSLKKQKRWLEISYNECKTIGIKKQYSIDEFGKLETLCSRYARSIDFLIRKFFRTIDAYEFENQGTLIDVVNRAEKRGLVNDIDEIHIMKDIRNSIAHEYLDDELLKIFSEVLSYSKQLIDMMEKSILYADKLID